MVDLTIEIDYELCIGTGVCALTAPAVFDQNPSDGRVVLLEASPGPESAEAVHEAVLLCPSGALSLRSDPAPPQ